MSEFVLAPGIAQKLEFAVNRDGSGSKEIEWLSKGDNFKMVRLLAGDEAVLVMKKKPVDTIIRIDRTIPPTYFVGLSPLHPELEDVGPIEYDLSKVVLYLHDEQKGRRGRISGTRLYEYLKDADILKDSLGVRDAREIQKKGRSVLKKIFKDKVVFFWKSIVKNSDGELSVPYLFLDNNRVVLNWDSVGRGRFNFDSAALFPR